MDKGPVRSSAEAAQPAAQPEQHFLVAPDGTRLPIPRELAIALFDFMHARKLAGSITIQFSSGEITCVESLAKKKY